MNIVEGKWDFIEELDKEGINEFMNIDETIYPYIVKDKEGDAVYYYTDEPKLDSTKEYWMYWGKDYYFLTYDNTSMRTDIIYSTQEIQEKIREYRIK